MEIFNSCYFEKISNNSVLRPTLIKVDWDTNVWTVPTVVGIQSADSIMT